MLRAFVAFLVLLIACPAIAKEPATVRVRLETSMGPIVIAVDLRNAPITARNFLDYVDAKRFDGTTFYRAARYKARPGYGLIQGGIDHTISRAFAPIAHEPTSKTGLKHIDGTVSMARNQPGTAMGDFFICVGICTYLDAGPNGQPPGYAAFGKVVSGMPVVSRILALPTYKGGYSYTTMGQSIIKRVKITTARRVN